MLACVSAVAGLRAVFCFSKDMIMDKKIRGASVNIAGGAAVGEGVGGMGAYETRYEGELSDALRVIKVSGIPLSGRVPTVGSRLEFDAGGNIRVVCKEEYFSNGNSIKGYEIEKMSMGDYLNHEKIRSNIRAVNRWKMLIHKKVGEALEKRSSQRNSFPYVPSVFSGVTGCYLFVTFRLHGNAFSGGDDDGSGYQSKDLDNLLKPVLDALYGAVYDDPKAKDQKASIALIARDSLVKGIKVRKERCAKSSQGIRIRCIATKTFEIVDVEPKVDGGEFMPDWKNPCSTLPPGRWGARTRGSGALLIMRPVAFL